jgi:hypothetical protein
VVLFFKWKIPVTEPFRVSASWDGYTIVIEARHDFAQWHAAKGAIQTEVVIQAAFLI